MREIVHRLSKRPLLAAQLMGASFFVNILGFASPIFVMLILGQYVSSGFDGTLITLASGMLIALLMQLAFRQARTLMAGLLSEEPDRTLAVAVFETLARARTMSMDRLGQARKREIPGLLFTVQGAYSPHNLCAVLDAPYSLLFIAAALWLSPILGCIGLVGLVLTLVAGSVSLKVSQRASSAMGQASAEQRGLTSMLLQGADTIRAFSGVEHLREHWQKLSSKSSGLRKVMDALRVRTMSTQSTIALLTRVFIYAVGAKECVLGEMTFAELIAANILTSTAIRQTSAFATVRDHLARATQAARELKEFMRQPLEASTGTALRKYSGRLVVNDVSFAFPGSTGPLFESLNMTLAPGTMTVVHGPNGSGKTTLARLFVGLLDPMRGEFLADGITLRQMAPDWWRQQLAYLPQEPVLLQGSLRENIRMTRPDADESVVAEAVARSGLERFISQLDNGLDYEIMDAGRGFPLGVRRRIALARALVADGSLALFDEPYEGLDADGQRAVAQTIAEFLKQGRSVVIFTSDPSLFGSATCVVDLGVKPVPAVTLTAPPVRPVSESDHDEQ